MIAVLWVTLLFTAYMWVKAYLKDQNTRPADWVPVHYGSDEYYLSYVIPQYDQVVIAIEAYHKENGVYPPGLAALVPRYLPQVPDVHIKRGDFLEYAPEPWRTGLAPFTFYVYGHYAWPSMHGWLLHYCPDEFDRCNEPGDRHEHWYRVNYRWVWIISSGL